MPIEGGLGGASQGLRRQMSDLCRQGPRSKRGSLEEYSERGKDCADAQDNYKDAVDTDQR